MAGRWKMRLIPRRGLFAKTHKAGNLYMKLVMEQKEQSGTNGFVLLFHVLEK